MLGTVWGDNGPTWPAVAVATGCVCVTALGVCLKLRKQKAAKKRRELAPQESREAETVNRNERDVFHGLRVVDMATHIAAPSVARVLGDLGAEVIKVEMPTGDLLRDTLTVFEPPRTHHGTIFENQNLSKVGAVFDLKTSRGVDQLRDLLNGADVLITNTRYESLKALGLDYETLSKQHPRLVYALVSAWGRRGAEKNAPGYDVGAFWTATGMCTTVSDEGNFSTYPGAFGDQTSAQFLLGSVAASLVERLRTGRGRFVETSLLHCGTWVLAPSVITGARSPDGRVPDYSKTPQRKLVDEVYTTSDGDHYAILYNGSFADEASAVRALVEAVVPISQQDGATYETVAAAVGRMDGPALQRAVAGARGGRLRLCKYEGILGKAERLLKEVRADGHDATREIVDATPEGYDDVPHAPRVPQEFLAGGRVHGPRRAAPKKGAHTDCVVTSGWLGTPRPPPADIQDQPPHALPLHGTRVLEISNARDRHDVAIAATGQVLRAAGCAVVVSPVVDAAAGSAAAVLPPALEPHYMAGKQEAARGGHVPAAVLDATDVIITDLTPEQLKTDKGIDLEQLKASRARVVVVQLIGEPPGGLSTRGEGDAFAAIEAWMTCGPANVLGGEPALDIRRFMEHGFENVASGFLYSAVTMGLYAAAKAQATEVVEVSYARMGHWLSQLQAQFVIRDPAQKGIALAGKQHGPVWRRSPLFVFLSHRSKDGMWIQLLGLDNGVHLPRLLNALGIKASVYSAAAYAAFIKALPNFKERNLLNRLEPIFIAINDQIHAGFAKYTYAELRERFAKHEVWHTPIRMPGQLLDWPQVQENGIITDEGGRVNVTPPVIFS